MPRATRRVYLGAIAFLWQLPWIAQLRVHKPDSAPENTEKYPRTTHAQTGLPGTVVAHQYSIDTEVTVAMYPHQIDAVSIEIEIGSISSAAGLTVDEARELGEELIQGAKEAVEWREKHANEDWNGNKT